MDKISKAIKCANCKSTLSHPVFLPCDHNICQTHVSGDYIQCGECGLDHKIPPSGCFPPNKPLAEIIASQIGSLDFGPHYSEAKQKCVSLEDELKKVNLILTDSSNVTFETINKMRNTVLLRSEKLKLKIDEETNSMLEKLDQYQQRCKSYLNTKEYENRCWSLQGDKEAAESDLEKWLGELNLVKVDEKKWIEIKNECEKNIARLREQSKTFESELHLNDQESMNLQVGHFDQIDIGTAFEYM
jgi:hypothetical protein